jgi:hypothetical protein
MRDVQKTTMDCSRQVSLESVVNDLYDRQQEYVREKSRIVGLGVHLLLVFTLNVTRLFCCKTIISKLEKENMKTLFAMAAVAGLMICSVGNVSAQETSAEKCDKCPASATAVASTSEEKACCDDGPCTTCSVAKAMEALPKMTYKVGEESTCCSEAAGELAKKANAPIHFVVGEKVFEEKEQAYTSLVEQTEEMVTGFITPSTCSTSGTHSIAGTTCKCSVEAGKKAEIVKAAADSIQVSYKVGEESCGCPTQAGEMAKKAGTEMLYVVAGEETCCSMTARLNTARAKYKAVVEALASADAPAQEAATETQGG